MFKYFKYRKILFASSATYVQNHTLGTHALENAVCEWLCEFLLSYSETRHQKRARRSLESYVFILRF